MDQTVEPGESRLFVIIVLKLLTDKPAHFSRNKLGNILF